MNLKLNLDKVPLERLFLILGFLYLGVKLCSLAWIFLSRISQVFSNSSSIWPYILWIPYFYENPKYKWVYLSYELVSHIYNSQFFEKLCDPKFSIIQTFYFSLCVFLIQQDPKSLLPFSHCGPRLCLFFWNVLGVLTSVTVVSVPLVSPIFLNGEPPQLFLNQNCPWSFSKHVPFGTQWGRVSPTSWFFLNTCLCLALSSLDLRQLSLTLKIAEMSLSHLEFLFVRLEFDFLNFL